MKKIRKMDKKEIELENRKTVKRSLAFVMALLYMSSISPVYMAAGEPAKNMMKTEKDTAIKQDVEIPDYARLQFKTFAYASNGKTDRPVLEKESKAIITKEHGGVITLGKVSLEIPAGAVREDVQISISRLEAVRETGETLKNVTEDNGGYRFLPAGMKFDKEVVVSIPYGKELNLINQELNEMHTYFYDVETKAWIRLDRKEIDKENGIVKSYTTHFTDMINATLVLPETASKPDFNINSLKKLESASPDGHLLKLISPKASNMGSGSFGFNIPVPAGRNGLQPSLAISYSSDSSNGIMGKGFDINYGSIISIDTRKGLPKYTLEYGKKKDPVMKDGFLLNITDEKIGYMLYEPEKQISYDRIERYFDAGKETDYFLVTDKKGTRTYYGDYHDSGLTGSGDTKAYIGENGIKKFVWYPTETIDTGNNRINYIYENDANYTYPSEIQYSFGSFNRHYFIKFIYNQKYDEENKIYAEHNRKDVKVDARSGRIIECRKLLTHIQVGYSGKTTRTYEFIYTEGIAKENYVKELKVWNGDCLNNRNADKLESYSYYFDYYGLEKNENGYAVFDEARKVSAGIPINKTSNSTSGGSVNSSAGVGFGTRYVDGRGTGGISGGSSSGTNYTNSALVDMNGDGIPDLVAQCGSNIKIFRGIANGGGFQTQGYEVAINTLLGKESSSGSSITKNGYGGAGTKTGFAAGYTRAHTAQSGTSEAKTGFVDVDGDGRPDIITGNGKFLKNESNGNIIKFTEHSIISRGFTNTYKLSDDEKAEYSKVYTMQRPFRAWRSRLSGKIEVSDTISGANASGKIYKGKASNATSVAGNSKQMLDMDFGEYIYFVPDSKDNRNDKDCEWSITIDYKTVRPYTQRNEEPFIWCPPKTLKASGIFNYGTVSNNYTVEYDLKDLYSKPSYAGSSEPANRMPFTDATVNLLSDWKKRLTNEYKKILFEKGFIIPGTIKELPKSVNQDNIKSYMLLYGIYKYDYTCQVFRLSEDSKTLDIDKLWQIKNLLKDMDATLSVRKSLSINSLDAIITFENSKTKITYKKDDEKNNFVRSRNATGFVGVNEIKEEKKDTETIVKVEHEIVLKDSFDDALFSKIIDEDGKIKVELSGNDNYRVKQAQKEANGDISIRIEDNSGLYEINQVLTDLTYTVPEMSDEEMSRLYKTFANNVALEDIAEDILKYVKTMRSSDNTVSDTDFSYNEIDSWKKNSAYAKRLDSEKLNALCNAILKYDSESNAFKIQIENNALYNFNDELEIFKNYRFHDIQFPFYSKKNNGWVLKEVYKAETDENKDSLELIASCNKAMGYGLYTKLKTSLIYKNTGEYEIQNGRYKQLSLNKNGEKWTVDSVSIGKTRYDTVNDYSGKDFVTAFKTSEKIVYGKENEELTPYCEEVLYGGNHGWYYGIWQGTESEHPFSEAELLRYDSSDIPESIGTDFDSSEYAEKCKQNVENNEVSKAYEFSYYLPSRNGSSIEKDAEKNSTVEKDALIGAVSTVMRRNEADADGELAENEKEIKFAPFVYKNELHCSRLGGDMYYGIEGIAPNADSGEFIIRKSRNKSSENSHGPSVNAVTAEAGITFSSGSSTTEMERTLQDVTGDRIPDIVLTDGIVYEGYITQEENLGFYDPIVMTGISKLMESNNRTTGKGASLNPNGCIQQIISSSGRLKGIFLSTGLNASDCKSTSTQTAGFIDINGDGISDYINGTELRLGNGKSFNAYSGFDGRVPLHQVSVTAHGESIGGDLGKILGPYENAQKISCSPSINISGGRTDSETTSNTVYSDINGDGLVDIINYSTNIMSVRFNTGNAFANPVKIALPKWIYNGIPFNVENSIDSSTSTTVNSSNGAGVSVNISIPLPPLFATVINITVAVGGSGTSSTSVTLAEQKLMDIDGDGLVDHVFCLANGDVYYKRNISGMNGLLNKIITPQGGIIEMEYEGVYGTVDMPLYKYLLKKVTVHDGNGITVPERIVEENGIEINDVHQYVTEYSYKNPKYDRYRKEFFGFEKMETLNPDGSYKQELFFVDFDKVHLKGEMILTQTSSGTNFIYRDPDINDGNNNDYVMSKTDYTYKEIGSCALITGEKTTIYERNNPDGIENITRYDYDKYGNVERILETTNNDSIKPLCAVIKYDAADIQSYIVANPSSIRIYDHEVNTEYPSSGYLRKREGYYNKQGWLERLEQFYDEDKNLSSKITYYSNGTVKSVKNADGTSMLYEYDTTLNQFPETIKFMGKNGLAYDSIVKYNVENQIKESETDSNGNTLKYEYDQWQRVVKIISPYDNGEAGAIEYEYGTSDTSFVDGKIQVHPFWYAKTKNKINFSNDRSIETLVQIDGLGQAFKTARTGCVYDSKAQAERNGWNVSGASIKDDKGRPIKLGQAYFEENIVLDSTAPVSLFMRYGTETKYDEKDRAARIKVPFDLEKTSEEEKYSVTRNKYSIDDNKFTAESIDAKGNTTETVCDAKSNIISVSKYGLDTGNKKLAHATYRYNAIGEMTEAYDSEGNEAKAEYDMLGRKVAIESRDSGRYIYEYGGDGKLQYESNTRLIAEGKRIGYFYDNFGRLSKIDYPDTKETAYEYGNPNTSEKNARGRLTRVSDSSGVTEYAYGKLGEIQEVKRTLAQKHNATLPEMTAVTKFESNYLGQIESITYPDNETVSYTYDDAGQVTSVKGMNGYETFNYVDRIGYDEFGQRIYIKYGNGIETDYGYKKETRLLESIKTENAGGQLFQNIKYSFDSAGNIESYVNSCKDMGNYETRQSYRYDSLYQLTGVDGFTDFNKYNISGTSTFRSNYSQSYEFDSIGNMKLKKSKEVIHTGTKTGDDLNYELNYVKDPLYAHRFISIGDRYYKYDEVGNIIGEQTGPYSDIQEDSELIKSIGGNVYGVETAWGFYGDEEETDIRKAKKYHREYQWDERNQLIRSKDNNAEVMFVYGQDGKRSNKYTIDAETLYFNSYWSYYIDPSASSSGGKVSKHIFLGETRIATSVNSYSNVGTGYHGEEKDHIYFYHSDHLGSASLITDYKGDEYQRIEYTPYGESWIDIKIMGATSVMPLSYKFSAKEHDEETGLYYYGARYLDPKISMWISADPALGEYIPDSGNVGSLPGMGGVFNHINFHLYAYAGNSPVRYTDPDGRIQFQVQAKYTMQDANWGSRQLTGTTGESNTLAKSGCAVTVAANLFNTLGFSDYNPAKVNKEFVTDGAINWESVGNKLGLQVEALKNTQLTRSTLNKQNQDKNTGYLTFVNVNYESDKHDHWVGITGITQKDGKDYLIISQTSDNDNAVGKDNLRDKQGWLKDDNGNILVPVSETKGYVNFKAPIVYE